MGKPAFSPIRDFISGVIMAATSVPQLVGYAETVGIASYRGLATAGPSLFAWGLTTGSPFMNSGVTSVTALMAKTDLGGESYVAEFGEEAYVKLVASYSLWVGFASIFLALVGFGKLAKSVPKNVRVGFKWGCSVGVVGSAIPNGLLANGSSELKKHISNSDVVGNIVTYFKSNFPAATGAVSVTNVLYAISNPSLWGIIPAVVFFTSTYFVMQGPKFLPKALPPGTEVILATAAATLLSMYSDYPGAVVGKIPQLDPNAGIRLGEYIRIPVELINIQDLINAPIVEQFGGSYVMLIISATLFAAVNFLSIMGIASGFEAENGIAWSAPRELTAQGIACGVAGITGSPPVSGSMSRSLVSRMTGTTSQLACMITALTWIYLMPYMTIMSPTPKAALSAVIISAVIKSVLIPKDLIKMKGSDSFIGWGTGIATALTSPTFGFGIGLILASVFGNLLFPKKIQKKKMR
uniref:SLC26A/SulP transporter domain-containing protein n=1 Tax=Eucampia antarctica TaxID=49252 RepID=A0A7S2R504_9STRA|mmetsp:Transcript_16996/g.16408  ORF Transcript_16996/g.16408 Transcript_16996/m.16408 type:complete len:466 (+) Transcript_16996:85-1482(+)|eukprot:CAMPEP_0197835030 /NCGR_PEP_ID=MMETSP1437-20131217/24497_1 /TAXON_ID=49252 ORGANISM="Eucampia antarctica, Strain CCMP1452" /NCGR_SAMPLE_ID=MMETSP1437 /ASSEMBLY_ACC=CAM_ASM_001096 /LENGTH=465 /DNA_ID=CAMNT_0043440167 /DNA_START=39 /DNA_END=1439 /DNA_ORIENTATION=+